jgi:hypothetical protein
MSSTPSEGGNTTASITMRTDPLAPRLRAYGMDISTNQNVKAAGFTADNKAGITSSIETIAGTLQFTGGILTGFTAHTNNVYTQITE